MGDFFQLDGCNATLHREGNPGEFPDGELVHGATDVDVRNLRAAKELDFPTARIHVAELQLVQSDVDDLETSNVAFNEMEGLPFRLGLFQEES